MEENTINDDNREDETGDDKSNVKRLKTTDSGLGKSEDSSTSSNVDEKASTSSENQGNGGEPAVTFNSSSSPKKRNYRNHQTDNDESGEATAAEPSIVMEVEEEAEDNDWEDCDEDEAANSGSSSSSSSLFSDNVLSESSNDSENDNDIENHPLFKKEMPKHKWFAVSEIDKRQFGFSAKLQSRELFQRRCYGSLHCVRRLELMYKLEEHAGCVNSLNFHPDGSLLASGGDDLRIVIWDWKTGKSLTKFKTKHKANIFQSKFLHLSGDLHVASCARDGQVRLAQLSKEEGVRNSRLLGSHKGPCNKIIVLPEQPHIILSAGEDGLVLSHDVRGPKSTKLVTVKEDEREIALYSIHGHPLKSHEFCVSGRDSVVRVYDQRNSSKPTASYTPFTMSQGKASRNHHVTCAVYNHNGSEILASYSDADVYLFDVNDTEGKFTHQYVGHKNGATIKGVSFFGPKSEFVVSGSDCGHIYFWDRNNEALVQWLLADDNGVVNCLEPHPQLPFIATSGLDWDVKVWVPSCEVEPTMTGLQRIVRNNMKTKINSSDPSDINDSQMLWMLWRHLRNTSRLTVRNAQSFNHLHVNLLDSESNSSSSGSVGSLDNSEDDFDRAPNCSPS